MTKTKRIRNPSIARLHVALDVVAQLLSNALSAFPGCIFGTDIKYSAREAHRSKSGKDLLSNVVKPNRHCEVCAKGALIVAHTLRFNELTAFDLVGMNSPQQAHQLPEFPKRMMAEIETLFEGRIFDWNLPLLSVENIETLRTYSKENLKDLLPSDRLIHIMGLLIKNRGHFVLLGKLPQKKQSI